MTLRLALFATLLPLAAAATEPRGALHLGTGGGGWELGSHATWFGDVLARDPLRLLGAVEVEAWRQRSLHAGGRLSALHLWAGKSGTSTTLTVARLEGIATLRAREPIGPYLRAGLGPAVLRHRVEVPGLASGAITAWGGALSLAAGAFARGEGPIELRLEAEASAQAWHRQPGGPDLSLTFGGTLGVGW